MKDTYYFPHDYHARNDLKMERVRIVMGCEGVGIYWCLVEILYEQSGTLNISDLSSLSKILNTTEVKLRSLINDYGLFMVDGDILSSSSVMKRLEEIATKRSKARVSAELRWGGNANAMRTQCDGNAIKERKGKERKDIEPTPVNKDRFLEFVLLTKEEYQKLVSTLGQAQADSMVARLNDYIGSKGVKYKSHYHTILSWVRKDAGSAPVSQGGTKWNKLKVAS